MISLGAHFRGPELDGAKLGRLIRATMMAVERICGPCIGPDDFGPAGSPPETGPYFELGVAPAVNVVFYVSGSLGDFDIPEIKASRFSRKDKLALVAVPVTRDQVASGGSVEFVIEALHEANRIAAVVFARKSTELFDLERAEAIVCEVRRLLVDQGF